MNLIAYLLISCSLLSPLAHAQTGSQYGYKSHPVQPRHGCAPIYNQFGANIGQIDRTGSMRNQFGALVGRIDGDGQMVDQYGASAGRVDGNGTVYDQYGATNGVVTTSGGFYRSRAEQPRQ